LNPEQRRIFQLVIIIIIIIIIITIVLYRAQVKYIGYIMSLFLSLLRNSGCRLAHKFYIAYAYFKLSHYKPLRLLGERRYSSYSFSAAALDGSEWSESLPGRALRPGKGPGVPIVQEFGLALQPVWTQTLQAKSFRLCRVSNLDRPYRRLVSIASSNRLCSQTLTFRTVNVPGHDCVISEKVKSVKERSRIIIFCV
jgi:hypothetical protein